MRSLLIVVVTIVAAVSALATAIAVPLVYLLGWDTVTDPFFGITFSLVALGLPFALIYVLSNVASGISDQEDEGLYWVDYIPSVIAWVSISVTAAVVAFGLFRTNVDIVRVIKESFGLQLLLGLLIFSWVDRFWLQRYKHRMLTDQLRNPAAPPPQLATYVAQPVSRTPMVVAAILATLLVILLIAGAIYASRAGVIGLPGVPVDQSKSVNDMGGVCEKLPDGKLRC